MKRLDDWKPRLNLNGATRRSLANAINRLLGHPINPAQLCARQCGLNYLLTLSISQLSHGATGFRTGARQMAPRSTMNDIQNLRLRYSELPCQDRGRLVSTRPYQSDLRLTYDTIRVSRSSCIRPVKLLILSVFFSRSPTKVFWSIIRRVSIVVSGHQANPFPMESGTN